MDERVVLYLIKGLIKIEVVLSIVISSPSIKIIVCKGKIGYGVVTLKVCIMV